MAKKPGTYTHPNSKRKTAQETTEIMQRIQKARLNKEKVSRHNERKSLKNETKKDHILHDLHKGTYVVNSNQADDRCRSICSFRPLID